MDQSASLKNSFLNFLKVVENEERKKDKEKDKRIEEQTEETGQIAFWYEKIRIAIDYREDHLLRRTASRRILKRLFIIESRREGVADLLLKELIMGGYVKKKHLSEEKLKNVDEAMKKYSLVFDLSYEHSELNKNWVNLRRWLLSIASFEVDEILYPKTKKRALINAVYEHLVDKINTSSLTRNEKEKRLQTYIAIYRSLAKADRAMVTSEIFRIYFPDWFLNPSEERIRGIFKDPIKLMNNIKNQAINPLSAKIFYAIKKQALYAFFLFELAKNNPRDFRGILSQEYILRGYLKEEIEKEYTRVRSKLNRRLKRGVIYILLTKILIALAVEVPLEILLFNEFNKIALAVNIIFPPLFMVFLAKNVSFPGEENTEAIINGVNNMIYKDKGEALRINIFQTNSRFSEISLNFIYFIIFSAVFGGVVTALYYLNFDIINGSIFLLFLATVSFFGALIRQSVRDLVVIKEKEGLGSLFFDTMLLPFVRLGRWLSTNFSRINVFMFLLDVIIEAPFKMVIRLIESWIAFLKRKREEVDQQFH